MDPQTAFDVWMSVVVGISATIGGLFTWEFTRLRPAEAERAFDLGRESMRLEIQDDLDRRAEERRKAEGVGRGR